MRLAKTFPEKEIQALKLAIYSYIGELGIGENTKIYRAVLNIAL